MDTRPRRTILNLVIFLVACAALLQLPGYSIANPLFMGGLNSVHPFGAQDVVRNPALIVWLRQDNAMGLLLDYRANPDNRAHILSSDSIARENINSQSGLARLSLIHRSDIVALGWDINLNYDLAKQRVRAGADNFKNNSLNALNRVQTETGTYGASLTFSAGIAIDASHSCGVQVIAGYSKNETTNKVTAYLYIPVAPFFDIGRNYERNLKEQVTAIPGIGYLGKIEKSEIGLMLTVGRLMWEKREAWETLYDAARLGSKVRAHGRLPFYFKYDVGPGLLAGSYSRLCDFINAGLELEIIFPLSYKTQFLEQFGNYYPSSIFLKSGKMKFQNKVANNPLMSLRGGFEFLATSNIILSLGGGMGLISSRSRILGGLVSPNLRDEQSYQKIESFYGTTGIDFVFGKYHTIGIGAVLSHTTLSVRENRYQKLMLNQQEPIAHMSDAKIKVLSVDAIVSSSFGF